MLIMARLRLTDPFPGFSADHASLVDSLRTVNRKLLKFLAG